ncbi:MAG: hypothetical protein K0B15_06400 [Lentimicrobium sp.]|nr:hypothetical protein [Lentimicrobium sp.]
MKKLLNILFLSCFKATELIEKKLHFKLSAHEKIQLKVHKMMCDACSRYEKQSIFLEKGIATLPKKDSIKVDMEQLKHRIADKLEKDNS